MARPRATSPIPPVVHRKSLSPGPVPDGQHMTGIPYGPDSYNALNPVVSASPSPAISMGTVDRVDPDAKIITHDGREIDPSDHIPESNYAPLLEQKGAKKASPQPDRSYRGSPRAPDPGAMRQQARPAARGSFTNPQYVSSPEPSTPQPMRTKLQKKANRIAAQAPTTSSPLAPMQHYPNSRQPRQRASMGDFENEQYTYGTSPGYRQGPPLPAKVPMSSGPPSRGGYPNGAVQNDPWALMDEMRNIDLGSGSSRRRRV